MKTIYELIAILFIVVVMGMLEIYNLKKKVKEMQKQIEILCVRTGNEEESLEFVSDVLKEKLQNMKKNGKIAEAVKELRENKDMGLLEAKQFIDSL